MILIGYPLFWASGTLGTKAGTLGTKASTLGTAKNRNAMIQNGKNAQKFPKAFKTFKTPPTLRSFYSLRPAASQRPYIYTPTSGGTEKPPIQSIIQANFPAHSGLLTSCHASQAGMIRYAPLWPEGILPSGHP